MSFNPKDSPIHVSSHRVTQRDSLRRLRERRLPEESIVQRLAFPTERTVRFGREQSGIDFQMLLHGEKLHAVHLLMHIQLDGQWCVAEQIAGTQRQIVAAYGQQDDVVYGRQDGFLLGGEGHPHREGVRDHRMCELQL